MILLSNAKSSVFRCPYENTKTAFSKVSTFLKVCVFGDRFHLSTCGREAKTEKKRLRFQTKTDT